MSDFCDQSSELSQIQTDIALKNTLSSPKMLPGFPGECESCGEQKHRLLRVPFDGEMAALCGACRDYHGVR